MKTIPYTYYIFHKPTGKKYYGVRYRKGCHPSDLWVKYFTSSKLIHQLIKEYGKNSFLYEVRKIFNTPEEAKNWEAKVLERIHAVERDDWLNLQCKGKKFHCPVRTNEHTLKIANSNKGKKRSEESKQKMSKAQKGKRKTEEYKQKHSEIMTNLKLKRTPEQIENYKKAAKIRADQLLTGKKQSNIIVQKRIKTMQQKGIEAELERRRKISQTMKARKTKELEHLKGEKDAKSN